MRKILLIFCALLFISSIVFAQRFSQYNTGTAFDSFENPSQRSFIPDSSRSVSFNFFLPTFNTNFFLNGDAQTALKNRAFTGIYNDKGLIIGQNQFNRFNFNANDYLVMLKIFTSLTGNQEIGFSFQTRAEGRGVVTDETVQLFSNYNKFTSPTYTNVFNDHVFLQTYHQVGFTYREKVNKQVAVGFKISALSGISYNEFNVNQSAITFDKENDQANISLNGDFYSSYKLGTFGGKNILPTFKNPGLSVSLGTSYRNDQGVTMQWNIKDLGFIYWTGTTPQIGNFGGSGTIHSLSQPAREDSIYKVIDKITTASLVNHSFTTPVNGLAEFSATKTYLLSDDRSFTYSPTLVVSKELFYTGLTGALVNRFQYKKLNATFTASYDDMHAFNFGGQFMLKGPNGEFFIGSERLFQTVNLMQSVLKNYNALNKNTAFSGADFFIGFSFKFGYFIEHPENASYNIPNGEKGFIGRFIDKIFKPRVL